MTPSKGSLSKGNLSITVSQGQNIFFNLWGEKSDFCQDNYYMEVSSWSSSVFPRKRLDIFSSGGEIRLQSKCSVRFKIPQNAKDVFKKKLKESYQKIIIYSSPMSKPQIWETNIILNAHLLRVTVGSRHSVNEVFVLPGCYTAQIRSFRSFGTTCRSHFQGSGSRRKYCDFLRLFDFGTNSLSKTPMTNCESRLCNITE